MVIIEEFQTINMGGVRDRDTDRDRATLTAVSRTRRRRQLVAESLRRSRSLHSLESLPRIYRRLWWV